LIGHFSADELASYRAGAVSPRRAARIDAHLAGCDRCAGVDAGLADVSVLLASVPVPPMPDRLAERLNAALAAEAERRTAGAMASAVTSDGAKTSARAAAAAAAGKNGDEAAHVPGRPDLPDRATGPRRRPRLPDWSSPLLVRGLAVAGVLVLVAGGVLLITHVSPMNSTSTSASAPRPAVHQYPAAERNSGIATAGLGASVRYRYNGKNAITSVMTANIDYTPANIARGIRRNAELKEIMAGAVPINAPTPAFAPRASAEVGHVPISRIAGCLSALAVSDSVTLVQVARYLSKPALVVILSPVDNLFHVIVVGLACSAGHKDIVARLTARTK
jgi:hypothetical protein